MLCSQTIKSPYSDTLKTNIVNIFFADSLFVFTSSNFTFLDYNDCNNCPLRAHIMTFVFSKCFPDIKTGKVWLFADSKLSSRRDYYKTHRKEFLKGINSCPQWGFHVAPVLIFDNDTIVIDPSTQNNPVPLQKWINDISLNTLSYIILKDPKFYSYPEDEFDLYEDQLNKWKNKHEFSSLEGEINFMAQKLTHAYHNIFDPVRFYYYKKVISKLISMK